MLSRAAAGTSDVFRRMNVIMKHRIHPRSSEAFSFSGGGFRFFAASLSVL
jgi:hypothetical protein